MISYLKSHETYIRKLLDEDRKETDWKHVARYYRHKVRDFQHERLIHLLVMITTAIAALLSFFFTLLLERPELFMLAIVLLVLSFAYVLHYFKLENGVQRLYRLGDTIEEKILTHDTSAPRA